MARLRQGPPVRIWASTQMQNAAHRRAGGDRHLSRVVARAVTQPTETYDYEDNTVRQIVEQTSDNGGILDVGGRGSLPIVPLTERLDVAGGAQQQRLMYC